MYECAKFDDNSPSGERTEILAVADSNVVSGQGLVLALKDQDLWVFEEAHAMSDLGVAVLL
jgi:hypothetical protein